MDYGKSSDTDSEQSKQFKILYLRHTRVVVSETTLQIQYLNPQQIFEVKT
jgi:hypothetical protein